MLCLKEIIDAQLWCLQMKEGQIEEGSAAWQAMSAADRTKRTRAAAEAKLKLKSPNFFVSRTRLCLRNLPHQISEKALKDLIIAAVGPRARLSTNAGPLFLHDSESLELMSCQALSLLDRQLQVFACHAGQGKGVKGRAHSEAGEDPEGC